MAEAAMAETPLIGPMPQIGYGTWKRRDAEAYRCTLAALEAGYRHVDTAEGYGNEAPVGRAIRDSGLARAEVFLTTKVAPDHLGPGQVRPHAEASLERLGTDQVDLLLIHWPAAGDRYPMEDYLGQLAEVYDAGLARFIGVSNFTRRHIDAALRLLGDRPITTNQVEIHPLMQNRAIVEHCRARDIPLTAYSPLARGAVAEVPEIVAIAKAHGATPGQVALAFLMAEGHVVIPTSSRPERIRENLAARALRLGEEEIAVLRGLDRGRRLVDPAHAPAWD
jgi:2,5-diketo-D-gluconate reductase B